MLFALPIKSTLTSNATSASNRTGPLSYTNAVNGPTSIRSFTSDEDYESIMASIDEFINTTEPKSGLHAAQIQATKTMAEEGKVAWVQYVVVPQGGIGSVAKGKANTSIYKQKEADHPFNSQHLVCDNRRHLDPSFGAG